LVIHNTKASVFEDQCWSTTASLGKNGCELTETPIAGFRFFQSIVMHTDIVIVILISLNQTSLVRF
jgi:hypothetical protein